VRQGVPAANDSIEPGRPLGAPSNADVQEAYALNEDGKKLASSYLIRAKKRLPPADHRNE
jgi:hypothetical protein